jgi:hypothetical protein
MRARLGVAAARAVGRVADTAPARVPEVMNWRRFIAISFLYRRASAAGRDVIGYRTSIPGGLSTIKPSMFIAKLFCLKDALSWLI